MALHLPPHTSWLVVEVFYCHELWQQWVCHRCLKTVFKRFSSYAEYMLPGRYCDECLPLIVDTAFDFELQEVDMDIGPVDDVHDLPVPNGKESTQNRSPFSVSQSEVTPTRARSPSPFYNLGPRLARRCLDMETPRSSSAVPGGKSAKRPRRVKRVRPLSVSHLCNYFWMDVLVC